MREKSPRPIDRAHSAPTDLGPNEHRGYSSLSDDLGAPARWRNRVPWLEIFVCVQFLWGAALIVPGAQEYRGLLRALPYLFSLGLLALYLPAPSIGRRPDGARVLMLAMGLLALNLLHPTSQTHAGTAQLILQCSIVASMFWAFKAVRSTARLTRMLLLIFALNTVSAALGILQTYYPELFMPPAFSKLGLSMNEWLVDSLTYEGRDGRLITRPPGLTDLPGGAAVAGGIAALLGIVFSLQSRKAWHLSLSLGAAAAGFVVVYLTHVRSVLIAVVISASILGVMLLWHRRMARAVWVLVAGGALVVSSFQWASSVGGDAVARRFATIGEGGPVGVYQESRGHFVSHTLGELLDQFPMGAGVGRWGMMHTYFGDPDDTDAYPIYVELQLTGWLLDGGVAMWILYGGAILLSLKRSFVMAGHRNIELADAALAVAVLQIFIVGMAAVGPAFNTQLGILFWLATAAMAGAAESAKRQAAAVGVPATTQVRR